MQIYVTHISLAPKGISITRMNYIEGDSLFSVIRVNEVVMGSADYSNFNNLFHASHQGSFYKQPVSLIEM